MRVVAFGTVVAAGVVLGAAVVVTGAAVVVSAGVSETVVVSEIAVDAAVGSGLYDVWQGFFHIYNTHNLSIYIMSFFPKSTTFHY